MDERVPKCNMSYKVHSLIHATIVVVVCEKMSINLNVDSF